MWVKVSGGWHALEACKGMLDAGINRKRRIELLAYTLAGLGHENQAVKCLTLRVG